MKAGILTGVFELGIKTKENVDSSLSKGKLFHFKEQYH